MTYEISVCTEQCSADISQLAGRLGGICTEEAELIGLIECKFEFSLESMAKQFHTSVLHFPEIVYVGKSAPKESDRHD